MPRTKKRNIPTIGWFIKPLAIVLIIGGLFANIWMRTRVMEVQYQIGELRQTQQRLLDEQKDLIAEQNRYASPARIAVNASDLGLALPDRGNVYVVRYQAGDSHLIRVADRGRPAAVMPHL